jgi:hypothetical protein
VPLPGEFNDLVAEDAAQHPVVRARRRHRLRHQELRKAGVEPGCPQGMPDGAQRAARVGRLAGRRSAARRAWLFLKVRHGIPRLRAGHLVS